LAEESQPWWFSATSIAGEATTKRRGPRLA